jgi:transposase
MTVVNPPAWLQFRTDHPASLYRRMLKALLGGNTMNSGVVQSGDFTVTAQSTPNMSVRSASGFAFIESSESTTHGGAYYVHNDASVTLTVAASHATLTRYDLVVLRVKDQEYSGTVNEAALEVVQGTAASSPSEPAVPANAIVLARITVAAGATTITNANIADRRARAGGPAIPPLTVGSVTERNNADVAREGQIIYRTDTDVWEGYRNGAWEQIAPLPKTPTAGTSQITTDANGYATITHGLGQTPSSVQATMQAEWWNVHCTAKNATTFTLRFGLNTGGTVANSTGNVNWAAFP